MSSLALSVLLSLISAVAYAAGAIVQERVAAAGDGRSYAPLRNPVWWVAVALNGVGAALHVIALAYGPLSLVQPLGALTIVFALPMAALFVRRRPGATAWRGAVMATVGLAGLLALTGDVESHALGGPEQLMLATVTFGAVAALCAVAQGLRRPMPRSVVLATGAGVAFGMASVFTKTVAVEWTSGSVGSGLPTLLVIAALAAAGLLLSQAAYRGAGLAAPLAIVTVVNPVVAAGVGITLFGEQFRYGTAGTVLALSCGAVAAGGLILLTTQRLVAERLVAGPGSTPVSGSARRVWPGRPAGPAAPLPEPARREPTRPSAAEPGSRAASAAPVPARASAPAAPVTAPKGKQTAGATKAVSGRRGIGKAEPPDRFPAPTALSSPLTSAWQRDQGAGRVEFSGGRTFPAPPRRGDLPASRATPEGTVQTLTPPALR